VCFSALLVCFCVQLARPLWRAYSRGEFTIRPFAPITVREKPAVFYFVVVVQLCGMALLVCWIFYVVFFTKIQR
jgi:hypothetical protein